MLALEIASFVDYSYLLTMLRKPVKLLRDSFEVHLHLCKLALNARVCISLALGLDEDVTGLGLVLPALPIRSGKWRLLSFLTGPSDLLSPALTAVSFA